MTTIKTYKFKLYNSKKNRYLDRQIDIAASVWNYCIAMYRGYYKLFHKTLSRYQLMTHITKLKKTERYAHWNNLGSQAVQDVVERVDKSYQAFFNHTKQKRRGRKSPPHFCKKGNYKSFTLKQCGYSFPSDNRITINKREYKYSDSRQIEGDIATVTVKRTKLGEFYIYVVCKQECNTVIPRMGNAIGYDFGLKTFLTADDGSKINSPQWYKAALSELRQAHRAVSRCKKGSNNRKRAIQHLERIYTHISNRRRDWFFKLANEIVGKYAIICIEDLNIDGMKRLWGRKVSDVAFAEFVSILEYAASRAGSTVVKIDRWAPSSQLCSHCGYINPITKDKRVRTVECPSCGSIYDRDINAAINIKKLGLASA